MSKKVLIVDDSFFTRNIIKEMLSETYDVLEAGSALEAERQIKREDPDLILLDIIMKEGPEAGVHILEEVLAKDPKAKIVMLTFVGQKKMIDRCKQLGALDYIVKPFDKETIIATINKYI